MISIRLDFPWGTDGLGKTDLPADGTNVYMIEATSVQCLLELKGFSMKSIGLISVNGVLAQMDYVLKDRDHIQLYPLLEGG